MTDAELGDVLSRFSAGADIDARGTTFTEQLSSSVLAAFSKGSAVPVLNTARFDRARFSGEARFAAAQFSGSARFDHAQFDRAYFDGARFSGGAVFGGVQFGGDAQFGGAQFSGNAQFGGARFSGEAVFDRVEFRSSVESFFHSPPRDAVKFSGAQFSGVASFGDARFGVYAEFSGVEFSESAYFRRANFLGDANFRGAKFGGAASFDGAQFINDAWFYAARFDTAEWLGPVGVGGVLIFDRAVFGRSVQIEAAAAGVWVSHASFAANASLRLRYASTVVTGVVANGRVTIAAAGRPFVFESAVSEGEGLPTVDESAVLRKGRDDATPTLHSLEGVDASRLVLVDLDLSSCSFAGAHHLDQLRLEGRCRFANVPGWVRAGARHPLPVWRYTSRQILDEECAWRAQRVRFAWSYEHPTSVGAERISAIYRQLRKAQEDAKNEPGAADFYYGEMEMRRHAPSTHAGERLILTLYWAFSGYGLRATRAVAALLTLLALTTVGFATVGFAPSQHVLYQPAGRPASGEPTTYQRTTSPGPRPGWAAAVDHSVNSATSLLRTPESPPLTWAGKTLEVLLRLLGPLLVGLALLAVRNRVKR